MKQCKVIINENKETIEAVFYGVFQRAWTHGESLSVGGYSAGISISGLIRYNKTIITT